jgi:hypothetical protein
MVHWISTSVVEKPVAIIINPADGGSRFVYDIGKYLPYYAASHHKDCNFNK